MPDPQASQTFQNSKAKWEEPTAPAHAPTLKLYHDLIAFRRQEPAYYNLRRAGITVNFAGEKAVMLLLTKSTTSRCLVLIVVNLGEMITINLDKVADVASGWNLILDCECGLMSSDMRRCKVRKQEETS